MVNFLSSTRSNFYYWADWPLFIATIPLLGAGLVTMNSFVGESSFFNKQIIWVFLSLAIFLLASFIDWRFLRRTWVSVSLFLFSAGILVILYLVGQATKGAVSWFDLGAFSLQPSDPIKIFLIIILAKYFSRRHVEIANFRHILVSGFYAGVIFLLVLIQPDFGSAIIIFMIWFGLVFVSGISRKHLFLVTLSGVLALSLLWAFVFAPYQKARILTFIHPLTDTTGAGYNALQSTIAVGSGGLFGKGIGYGTQSRLEFLPEYETDFIFAAFAEEWGFVGVVLLFFLFGVVFWRILLNAMRGSTNFEILYGLGVAIMFMSHFIVHVGMNIGLLPVTGTTVPFLSYGGSHLFTEFLSLGILVGMRKYQRVFHKDDTKNEFLGIEKSI
jgi:rod shape determining protein RodA